MTFAPVFAYGYRGIGANSHRFRVRQRVLGHRAAGGVSGLWWCRLGLQPLRCAGLGCGPSQGALALAAFQPS